MAAARLASLALAVGLAAGATPAFAADPPAEDPDVVAAFKAKGWTLKTREFFSPYSDALSSPLTLTVEDPKSVAGSGLTPDDYALIARSKTAQMLDLSNVNTSDAGLRVVAGMPRLRGIIVLGRSVTDAGVKALAGCRSLETVHLGTERVTDAGVRELAALPNLRTLSLAMVPVHGSAFEAFAEAKSLAEVTVSSTATLTDDGVRHLARIPNLRTLDIRNLGSRGKVTTAGIRLVADGRVPARFKFDPALLDDDLFVALVGKGWLYGPRAATDLYPRPAAANRVRRVELTGANLTDRGFAALLPCVNVDFLDLTGTGVTDESLKKMAGFRWLTALHLGRTKVTAAGLEAVAGLPLRRLSLDGRELTEDAFKAVGRMASLDGLNLSEAKMNAGWIAHLSGLSKLKDLDVTRAAFDDAAAKVVAGMSGVETVRADETKLTDTGFADLLKLPRLKSLSVYRTGVTDAAYQKAKKDYPKVYVSH